MKFSVVDMFVFIIRRWWKMLIVLAVFAGLGVALAFVLPKRYQAEVHILPTPQESGLAGALAGLQSELGLQGLSIPGGEANMALLYGEILRSRTVLDQVIDSCNVLERMDVSGRDEAYSLLLGNTSFTLAPEQIFTIKVIASDSKLVADLANSFTEALDNYLSTSSNTRGRHMREFVEERLAQVEPDLTAAQDSLAAFQSRHQLPMINPETSAGIQEFADLRVRAMEMEIELDYLQRFSTGYNPQYENTRRELSLIRSKLATLPPLTTRYLELYRDFIVQQQVYMLLVQQLEQAKLQEAKDTPLLSILEWAVPPEVAYFPPKKLVVIVMLLVGLVMIVFYALIRTYWEHVIEHPDKHQRMTMIRSAFKESFTRRKR